MALVNKIARRDGYAKSILLRFAHLLSAQGVEGIASTLFFLYLAWLDKDFYGEVMLALAAGAILTKVVNFGLYYPQVADLGRADDEEKAAITSRVNIIKGCLLFVSVLALWGVSGYRGYSTQLGWILLVIALGFGIEELADTFFADMRVRGLQKTEARIKILASAGSYGYGLVTALLGFPPVFVALFKLVSGSIRLIPSVIWYAKTYSSKLSVIPSARSPVIATFRTASIFALIQILGTVYNKLNYFFLEQAAGRDGVAVYSATYNIVDPVSILASEQLLGWVVFPVLSVLWWTRRDEVALLVRNTALWLIAIAVPIMFVLHAESGLIIGLLYPSEFAEAASLQTYLVWSILLSFESNLFQYVMVVAGAARTLLLFQAITTAMNLFLNVLLVGPLGPLGACLVLVLTKLTMTMLAFVYCQASFRFFKLSDFVFPIVVSLLAVAAFAITRPLVGQHVAVVVSMIAYGGLLWKLGFRHLGVFPKKFEG